MFDTIAMVILTVKDMKESVFFYEKVLGLPLKFQSPEWSEFKTKGARLGLHAETDTLKVSASQKLGISFGFSVTSLDDVYATLHEKGVQFVTPPRVTSHGKLAIFKDPNNYLISLGEEDF